MRLLIIFIVILVTTSCNKDTSNPQNQDETYFTSTKWKTKKGDDYPYREKLLDSVVYNDTIRELDKEEIITLLGTPNRTSNNFLYYTISEKRIGFWTLHATTMVIKFVDDDTIEWIKIQE